MVHRFSLTAAVLAGLLTAMGSICEPAFSGNHGITNQAKLRNLARRFSDLGLAHGHIDAQAHVNMLSELKADRALTRGVIQGDPRPGSDGPLLLAELNKMPPRVQDHYIALYLAGYKQGAVKGQRPPRHTKEELLVIAIVMYTMDNERFPDLTRRDRLEKSVRPYLSAHDFPSHPIHLNTWLSRRRWPMTANTHPLILLLKTHDKTGKLFDVYFTDGKRQTCSADRLHSLKTISHMN